MNGLIVAGVMATVAGMLIHTCKYRKNDDG
jgi:hypothetical protein